jgi:exopolysaccharide production protein ExoQ
MLKPLKPQHRLDPQSPSFRGQGVLAMLPIVVFFYVLVILPFMGGDGKPRIENMLFWPMLAGVVLLLAVANSSKLDKGFFLSPPIVALVAYLAFAAASIGWAYSPDSALSRYLLQVLAVIIVIVPYALPIPTTHTLQRLQLCCVIAAALNAYFVLTTPASPIGHTGYFTHKQELGMFCGISIILSTHELLFRGWRRVAGVVGIALTFWIISASHSKGPLAFSALAMPLAVLALVACRVFRTTPAFILGAFTLGFSLAAWVTPDIISRIGWRLYGDPTFTGRTFIWNFINYQISHFSWFGWGFHSYWGVPNSPHNAAPGFIREMISSHSGYLELKLDTGYIGYWIFLVFLYASVHYLEPLRRKDPMRAWIFLSIAIYVILLNLTESIWLQMTSIWMLYLIVVGETVRITRSQSPETAAGRRLAPNNFGRGLAASMGRVRNGTLNRVPLARARS